MFQGTRFAKFKILTMIDERRDHTFDHIYFSNNIKVVLKRTNRYSLELAIAKSVYQGRSRAHVILIWDAYSGHIYL